MRGKQLPAPVFFCTHARKACIHGLLSAPWGKNDMDSFTSGILNFFKTHASTIPAWARAAQIVFTFLPNSAMSERVFALVKSMFGDEQLSTLSDCIQASLMLRDNGRTVG